MASALPPRVSRPWVLAAAAIWLVSATLAARPAAEIPSGPFHGWALLLTDVNHGRFGDWVIAAVPGGEVFVETSGWEVGRGDRILVRGHLESKVGQAGGHRYGAVLDVAELVDVLESEFPPHRAGRAIRAGVTHRLSPFDDGRALLSGFLIGDTSRIVESDLEAMRRSGLAHFVAVSGSNVALFLGLLAVAAGPLALGPRRRAMVGLVGIPVYAAATGFEPSVMRASVMAAVALTGRLVGIVLEAWQLLALAVVMLLLANPELSVDVGFQLSVAATAGVLAGARWPLSNRRLRPLGVTLGAQGAVAPLLLAHFGAVPLLSPVVNLLAAPIVAASTVLGAIGTGGVGIMIGPAAWLAGMVLELARAAAGWPQLGAGPFALVVAGVVLIVSARRWRPALVVLAAVSVAVSVAVPPAHLPAGAVAILDVGQGDAILLHGGDGRYALVDGGPDATRLVGHLRDHGVVALDLVVVTHVHADHVSGLAGIVGRVAIGEVWQAADPHSTGAFDELTRALSDRGLVTDVPEPGDVFDLGGLQLRVEGPLRRYASPNDQSIVLTVTGSGSGRTMLLAGDIETVAQAELEHLRADVLKVPHQGAATSDPDWLRGVGASEAVISVGPNTFGHPADWVIETLVAAGAAVRRTDVDGTVIVDLGS